MFALCIEASPERGMGHLFRGLVLARALEQRRCPVVFLVNDSPQATGVLEDRGAAFEVVPLHDLESGWERGVLSKHRPRGWVNDRLDTDARHVDRLRAAGMRVATFDDYGTGAALCNLNVAALPMASGPPAGERVLAGMRYLVLDPEIERFRRVRQEPRSWVVTMGGSDTYGLTVEVVRALKARSASATIVIGPGFRHEAALQPLLDDAFTVKRGVRSLAEELWHHDFAITAGGITLFEACAAGLPCVAVAAEPWERLSIKLLAEAGACVDAGYRLQFDRSRLAEIPPLERMSTAAMSALDLQGAARVAEELVAA